MNTVTKSIILVVVSFIILFVLAIVKESGGGAIMWLGAIAIPLIYKSLFGKKDKDDNDDITLNKK